MMLRTIVLLVTHLTMLGAGIGLTLITLRARRQAAAAHEAALDVRELFLAETIEKRTARLRAETAVPTAASGGRHRARDITPLTRIQPPPARPRLSGSMGLDEVVAVLATHRAQRVQERRQFVDLMTGLVGPARIRQHVRAVAHVA